MKQEENTQEHEAIQLPDSFIPTTEDLAMIDRYYDQLDTEQPQLKASDIVPGFEQWEKALGTVRASERENELDAIRGGKEEAKEIDHVPER